MNGVPLRGTRLGVASVGRITREANVVRAKIITFPSLPSSAVTFDPRTRFFILKVDAVATAASFMTGSLL